MPGARKIEVDGKTYAYVLKSGRKVMPNWTVRLVLEFRPGRYVTCTFKPTTAGPIGFTPADTRSIVTALEFHAGRLPEAFDTGRWKLTPSVVEGVEAAS